MNLTESQLIREAIARQGYCCIRVGGYSMLPSIKNGDLICVESLENHRLRCGDIAAFFMDTTLIAHRIFGIRSTDSGIIYLTRGDAYFNSVGRICREDMLGKVVWLERNGRRKNLNNALWNRVMAMLQLPLALIYAVRFALSR